VSDLVLRLGPLCVYTAQMLSCAIKSSFTISGIACAFHKMGSQADHKGYSQGNHMKQVL